MRGISEGVAQLTPSTAEGLRLATTLRVGLLRSRSPSPSPTDGGRGSEWATKGFHGHWAHRKHWWPDDNRRVCDKNVGSY